MLFNYYFVDLPKHRVAELLSQHVSPQRYYHHNAQGGADWQVDTVSLNKTRITLHDTVDESVISFLLLKA